MTCDNQIAVFLANNQVYSENMKHIMMKILLMIDMIEQGEVELKKMRKTKNLADS